MHTRAKLTPVTRAALRHRPSSSGRRAGRGGCRATVRRASVARGSRDNEPRTSWAVCFAGARLTRCAPSLRHPTVLHHAPSRAGGSPKPGTTSNAPGRCFGAPARGADGFGGLDPGPAEDYCPRCGGTVERGEIHDGQCEPAAPEKSLAAVAAVHPTRRVRPAAEPVGLRSEVTRWRPSRARSRPASRRRRRRADGRSRTRRRESPSSSRADIPPSPPRAPESSHVAVARGVADRTGGRIVQPLKRDHRPSQTRVAPSRREANVANSIRPAPSGSGRAWPAG